MIQSGQSALQERKQRPPPVQRLRAGGGRRPHVVIVGAGFGGLTAACGLAKAAVDVTLIDRRNHHLFQPLLYQVATAALSPAEIAAPIRSVLRRYRHVTVVLDEVEGIDLEHRLVLTREHAQTAYDYLILAPGSQYSYFGHEEEWPRFAPGLKSIEDAVAIRRRLLLAFERAETIADPQERERLMTFVLVGAGPTGVEMAGAIAELAKAALARDFRHINPRSARIVLVEAGPRVLAGFKSELADYAAKALRRMGVEVRLETPIEAVDERGVIAKGERVEAANVIWCAGTRANPAGQWLGAETAGNGAVKVKPDLSVAGLPEVFVIGDAAQVPGTDGKPLPGLAQVAKQQGAYVARLIAEKVQGRSPSDPFRYRDQGTLATIGRSSAVADFGWITLKGRVAWLLWGLVHIYFLIGFRNRIAVFSDWIWSWFTYARGARLITGPEDERYARQSELREVEKRRAQS